MTNGLTITASQQITGYTYNRFSFSRNLTNSAAFLTSIKLQEAADERNV